MMAAHCTVNTALKVFFQSIISLSWILVRHVIDLLFTKHPGAKNVNLTVFHTRRSVAARVSLEADELRRNLLQALERRVQAERETQEAEDKVSRP